jgi:hypothetical protein
LGVVDPLEPVQPIKSSALLVVAEPWARLVMKDTFLYPFRGRDESETHCAAMDLLR